MKYVDSFFKCIIAIQNCLERMEKTYKDRQDFFEKMYYISVFIAVALVLFRAVFVGAIIGILGIVAHGFQSVIGWKYSVRKWLRNCVVYNFVFSIVISEQVQKITEYSIMLPLFVIIYMCVWVFLSLISNSEVSLLVNEVASGLAATIFTIGSYVTDLMIKEAPYSKELLSLYNSVEKDLIAGEISSEAWLILYSQILQSVNELFVIFLPIIGVTALSVIVIKIKVYWMKKNNIKEPEMQVGYKE